MIQIPRGSVEYLSVEVVADITLSGTVEVSVSDGTSVHTWLPATWQGSAGTTRTARITTPLTLSTANYPLTDYLVYVRVTASPETVIVAAGALKITP